METWFRQTAHDARTCADPRPAGAVPVASPAAAPFVGALPESQVDVVLSLQRTAGNRATGRALGRKPDERTEEIDRHAADVGAGLAQDTADAHDTASPSWPSST